MLIFTQLVEQAFQNIGPFILSQPAQGAFLPFRALLILADLVFLDSSDSPEYVSPPEPPFAILYSGLYFSIAQISIASIVALSLTLLYKISVSKFSIPYFL